MSIVLHEKKIDTLLPEGWEEVVDFDGKLFYVDHKSKRTTWINPLDRLTKPQSFSDCTDDELPCGWEECHDPNIGIYYINHNLETNQLEDPRLQWRHEQHAMLKDYLNVAHEKLNEKLEICQVMQQRLEIAEEEVHHLSDQLTNLKLSRTSLNSLSSSGSSTKYDPDLLRQDVTLAKERVHRLKWDLHQVKAEVHLKQCGLERLQQVENKMHEQQYTVDQAHEILSRIRNNQKSLYLGEKEKRDLLQTLALLKDEIWSKKNESLESTPDSSMLCLTKERFSTASQTDLCGESPDYCNSWGSMVRLRYEEARKQVARLQEELVNIEDQMTPGQNESDKDRLLLIQEKEQLLRELKSMMSRTKTEVEQKDITEHIKQLEEDLIMAMELSHKQIAERLKINTTKSVILQQLAEATQLTTYLESQLKSLSTSTLSVSSESSRGSLGSLSGSSKSSLASLSFTDLYTGSSGILPETDLYDLHKRVEKLLQGHTVPTILEDCDEDSSTLFTKHSSLPYIPQINPEGYDKTLAHSLSSLSSPSVPISVSITSYTDALHNSHIKSNLPYQINENLDALFAQRQFQHLNEFNYISRSTSELESIPLTKINFMSDSCLNTSTNNPPLSPISESCSSSGNAFYSSNTKSDLAAISDESVAGDSGVFDVSSSRFENTSSINDRSFESAQVKIKFKYEFAESQLNFTIVEAKNLSSLVPCEYHKIWIKAALLPVMPNVKCSFSTSFTNDVISPKFLETFHIKINVSILPSKTMQIHVCSSDLNGAKECVGCCQISLADFDPTLSSCKWYNILSFRFMQSEYVHSMSQVESKNGLDNSNKVTQLLQESSNRLSEAASKPDAIVEIPCGASSDSNRRHRNSTTSIITLKEESSDESTIVSSQTSTLTRNQGANEMHDYQLNINELSNISHEEMDEEEEVLTETEDELISKLSTELLLTDIDDNCNLNLSDVEFCDAETNTVLNFNRSDKSVRGTTVRRSQTFSPANPHVPDYICKLNRSDSDSSVKYRSAFKRTAAERRSLRHKKMGSNSDQNNPLLSSNLFKKRTSLDLELDYQASEVKLTQLHDDINRLKEIKSYMESFQSSASVELPRWFVDSKQFQSIFMHAEKLKRKYDQQHISTIDERAERRYQEATKEVQRLRQKKNPYNLNNFLEKMAFFTSAQTNIPIVFHESEVSSSAHRDLNLPACVDSFDKDLYVSEWKETVKHLNDEYLQSYYDEAQLSENSSIDRK